MKIDEKTGLRAFDIEYVRSLKPCYEPERYLKPGIRYNAVSILQDKNIPFSDRLWVVLRTDLASEKLMRLFAVWSARQVQHLMADKRSTDALDVAEKFSNGKASVEQLNAAEAAAGAAAYDAYDAYAARAAAYAAREAVYGATGDAAYGAAGGAHCKKLIEMFLQEGKERLEKRK